MTATQHIGSRTYIIPEEKIAMIATLYAKDRCIFSTGIIGRIKIVISIRQWTRMEPKKNFDWLM